jgi:hypothetical protein
LSAQSWPISGSWSNAFPTLAHRTRQQQVWKTSWERVTNINLYPQTASKAGYCLIYYTETSIY